MILYNEFQNHTKITATSPRGQWVKMQSLRPMQDTASLGVQRHDSDHGQLYIPQYLPPGKNNWPPN